MLEHKRQLLAAWHRSFRILHRGGFMAAKYYDRLNVRLGVPVVVMTSVAGSTIFATSGETGAKPLQYAAGAMTLLATVLASLQTFLAYGERAAKHKGAAVRYGELRTETQVMLTCDLEQVPNLDKRIESIRKRWTVVDREAPPLPQKIYAEAEAIVSARMARSTLAPDSARNSSDSMAQP